jgi:hypothetical protein
MPTIITTGAASARSFGFGASGNITITAGFGDDGYGNYAVGYIATGGDFYFNPEGSVSPDPAYFNGKQILSIYDQSGLGGYYIIVTIGGFSSDPTQSWFTSVSSNGTTVLTSAATTYFYEYEAANTATWLWSGSQFGFVTSNKYAVKFK